MLVSFSRFSFSTFPILHRLDRKEWKLFLEFLAFSISSKTFYLSHLCRDCKKKKKKRKKEKVLFDFTIIRVKVIKWILTQCVFSNAQTIHLDRMEKYISPLSLFLFFFFIINLSIISRNLLDISRLQDFDFLIAVKRD